MGKQNVTGCDHSENYLSEKGNDLCTLNGRIKDKFVSKNVVNLSKRTLTKAEVSLLSKGSRYYYFVVMILIITITTLLLILLLLLLSLSY